jgi:DnaJ-class molecular chaperone
LLGLKPGGGGGGGPGGAGQHFYQGNVDPHQTFRMFFVRKSVFFVHSIFRKIYLGGPQNHAQRKKTQDPPIEHELFVSLEEIASGATKKMKISRKVLNPDHRSTRTEDKVLSIDIKPGWKQGTKITFPREGDQSPTSIPADIIFIIKDKPHPTFRRDGSDLIYTAKISLKDVSQNFY